MDLFRLAKERKLAGGGGGGASAVINPIEITENGTYTAGEGVDGYSPITVNVEGSGGDESLKYIEGQHATVDLPTATSIKPRVFSADKVITDISMPKVTSIGAYAFNACSNLALTSLPAGLKSIGDYAFAGCTSIALTSLPDGLTSIGIEAFYSCSKLAITSLPAGLTSVGNRAFYGCAGLTEITFKGTPTSIANNAFNNCTNLKTINVPWAEGAVSGSPWGATAATINYNYTGG